MELYLMQDSAWSNIAATTGVGTLVTSKESQVLGGNQPGPQGNMVWKTG